MRKKIILFVLGLIVVSMIVSVITIMAEIKQNNAKIQAPKQVEVILGKDWGKNEN